MTRLKQKKAKKVKATYVIDEDVQERFNDYCDDNDIKKSPTVNRAIKMYLKKMGVQCGD